MADHKEIRVTIELDGTRYQYTQTAPTAPTDTIRDYTAWAVAKTVQDTIIEHWEEN